jgi:hypothetical protein
MKSCFYTSFAGDRHRHYFNRAGAGTLKKSVRGDPLQAGGTLRLEDALVYRSGLLNKTGLVEVTLRDKLNNFAHLFHQGRNSEEITQRHQQLVLGFPPWKTYAHHK